MKDRIIETLAQWEIPYAAIIAMCWDTTANNTGKNQGSATLFENEMNRAILWLGCRHHIGELHAKHPDTAVRPQPPAGKLVVLF